MIMIIITRKYETENPCGGCKLIKKKERKVFNNDDLIGIQIFLNEENEEHAYKWYNVSYEYIKV